MRSKSKFNDAAVLEILNDYVERNISVSLNLDLPSSDNRKWLSDVTGLQEKQITQWFFRAKRKCSEEVIKQFVLNKLLGATGGGSSVGLSESNTGSASTRALTSTSNNQATSTLNGKLYSAWKPVPLDELQLAILEQSWSKGLLKTPMYYLPISEVAGITIERMTAWAKNRLQLGDDQLFFPEERHFNELTTRLSSMGLLQDANLRNLLAFLAQGTQQKTKASIHVKRERIIGDDLSSRVVVKSENYADNAAVKKIDPMKVTRLHDRCEAPKQESMSNAKFFNPEPEWKPAQAGSSSKEIDSDPEWTPSWNRSKRSQKQSPVYKRELLSISNAGSGAAPAKKRKRGFDPDTLTLLNHAWNTQIILRSDMHEIIALLGDITVKQLKTWVHHKKRRNPQIKQVAVMRDARSRRFSDQQRTILMKAYDRNLLSGAKLAVIAELVQMSVKQVRTWCGHRRQRGPPKR